MIQMAQERSPGAAPDEIFRFCSVQCNQVLQMMRPKLLDEEGVTPQSYQGGLELYQEDDEVQKLIVEREDILNELRQTGIDFDEPQDVDFPEDLTLEKFLPIFKEVSKKATEAVDETIQFIEGKKDISPDMIQSLVVEKLSSATNAEAKKIFDENNITDAIYTEGIRRFQNDPQFQLEYMKFQHQQQIRAERLQKVIQQSAGGLLE